MKSLLLIIDVQKCFINEYTEKTKYSIEKLLNKNNYDFIVFGKFKNNKNSPFYKKLNYTECMNEYDTQIELDIENKKVIERCKYSLYTNELKKYIKNNNISKIYICGFDTDACIYKISLDLFENNYDVYVLKDYCASSGGYDMNKMALTLLNRQIGKNSII